MSDRTEFLTFGRTLESCIALRESVANNSHKNIDYYRAGEIMIPMLAAKNISTDDLVTGLDKEKSGIAIQAYFETLQKISEEDAERRIDAVSTLEYLQAVSAQNLYPSRKDAMIARWAKAFYEGNYAARQKEIDRAIGEGRVVGGNFNNEAGASYVRIVSALSSIAEHWRLLASQLDEASTKEGGPQAVFMALGSALDEYYKFVDNITDGLKQEGVVQWVGKCFQNICRAQQDVVKTCKPKMLELSKPLGERDLGRVEEWFKTIENKLGAALKAAGA